MASGVGRPIAHYRQSVIVDRFIFVAGQVAVDELSQVVGTDVATQTDRALMNLSAVLAQAGASLVDVVSVSAFLKDMRDFDEFERVYRSWFVNEPPARTTAGVELGPGYLVEMNAIAVKRS